MGEGWIPAQPEKPEREVRKQLPDSMVTTVIRFLRLPLLLSLLLCGCKPFVLEPVPDWAYPTNPAPPSGQAASRPKGHSTSKRVSFPLPGPNSPICSPHPTGDRKIIQPCRRSSLTAASRRSGPAPTATSQRATADPKTRGSPVYLSNTSSPK